MDLGKAILIAAIIIGLSMILCSGIDYYTFKEDQEIVYADDGMLIRL